MNKRGEREQKVIEAIASVRHLFPENVNFNFVGEKPMFGANGSIKEMKDRVRIQYKSGYGKYNYAPCLEITNY